MPAKCYGYVTVLYFFCVFLPFIIKGTPVKDVHL